jgi:hypothetical protein
MTMDQSSGYNHPNHSLNRTTFSLTDPDIDWSVFENAGRKINEISIEINLSLRIDRYLLRDDSVWITRLSKDFWWNLERISEMITTEGNSLQSMNSTKPLVQQMNNISSRKIVGQRSTITRPNTTNILDTINSDQDIEYNPFQSKISFDNNIWTNYFQQAIPWQ